MAITILEIHCAVGQEVNAKGHSNNSESASIYIDFSLMGYILLPLYVLLPVLHLYKIGKDSKKKLGEERNLDYKAKLETV